MKKLVVYIVLLQSVFSFSQYYSEDGFMFISKPNLDEAIKFYKNEYEFDPVQLVKKLSEIELESKNNSNPSVTYDFIKLTNGTTRVIVKVNNYIFSESYFQNDLLEGKKTIYNGKGAVFHEIEYKKGKANGKYKIYSDFGELRYETEFKNNLKHGNRTYYTGKKQTKLEGSYEKGILTSPITETSDYSITVLPKNLKSGNVKQYTLDNRLLAEYNLIGNGLFHGTMIVYNVAINKPYSVIPFRFDQKDGVASFYSQKGELLTKNEFRNNKKVGKHQYFEQDHLMREEIYDNFGNPTGIWKRYRFDGKISAKTEYFPNGSSIYTTYDTNEEINSINTYPTESKATYVSKRYDKGILTLDAIYENNKILKAVAYYANGTIFTIDFPKEQRYVREFYDKEGKLIHTNQISDTGKQIGVHKNAILKDDELYLYDETHYNDDGIKTKWVYKSGNGRIEYNYRNNTQHGPKINYDLDGNVLSVEYYYETNGKSKFVSKEEFEKLTKAEKK